MTRRRNLQHGQARRQPLSPVWPALGGILLAVLAASPFIHIFFGKL